MIVVRTSPRVYAEALVDLLDQAGTQRETGKILSAFVRLLARQGMLHRAEAILDEVERLLIEDEGFLRASVVFAERQDRERVARVEELIGALIGQPARAVVSVDPSLIAGFRARMEDLLLDASLRGTLARLRAQLT